MGRLHRAVTAVGAVVVIAASSGPGALAQARIHPEGQTVRLLRGSITGTVTDDGGGPLAGVVVSALGATMAMTVSDARGYYALGALPMGEYVVQAHLTGFAGSSRERVQVGAESPAVRRFQLRKLDAPVGTAGTPAPVSARPIMAAGFGLPASTLSDQPDSTTADASADHPHDETAWRLRHIKRSILKDASSAVTFADGDGDDGEIRPGSVLWRALDSTADLASSLFGDMPLSGEVNLLTSGAFAPGDLFSGDTVPRGVAYLSIGLPTGGGDWTMRAAMSEGDLSSWNVAGAFASHPGSTHTLDFGAHLQPPGLRGRQSVCAGRRDRQQPQRRRSVRVRSLDGGAAAHGRIRQPLRATTTTCSAATCSARVHRWRSSRCAVPGLSRPWRSAWSRPAPRSSSRPTLPARGCRPSGPLRLCAALPTRRTCGSSARERSASASSTSSRTQSVVSVQRFFQRVDDQLVTLFGLNLPDGPDSAGHYFVASAGAVDADGWAVRVSNTVESAPERLDRLQHHPHAAGWARGDVDELADSTRPVSLRPETEDLARRHDVARDRHPRDVHPRVRLYKVNTGLRPGRSDTSLVRDSTRGFDVQVNQALPFDFAGTRWEILVGLRNLFRDPDRSRLGLRRAARGPAAQARRRRFPRPLLRPRFTNRSRSVRFLDPTFHLVGSSVRRAELKLLVLQRFTGTYVDGLIRGTALASPTPGLPSCQPFPSLQPGNVGQSLARIDRATRWSSRRLLCLGHHEHRPSARTWTEMEDGVLWRVDRQRRSSPRRSRRGSPADAPASGRATCSLAIDKNAADVAGRGRRGAARGVARHGADLHRPAHAGRAAAHRRRRSRRSRPARAASISCWPRSASSRCWSARPSGCGGPDHQATLHFFWLTRRVLRRAGVLVQRPPRRARLGLLLGRRRRRSCCCRRCSCTSRWSSPIGPTPGCAATPGAHAAAAALPAGAAPGRRARCAACCAARRSGAVLSTRRSTLRRARRAGLSRASA